MATIQGYSVVPDIEASSSSTLPLLQRCNYHSNMVLRAILNEYDPETSTNTVSTDIYKRERKGGGGEREGGRERKSEREN